MTENEFKRYLALGLIAPGVWGGEKEATMYSYNGVVLPKLTEWDKTVYPYAFIDYFDGSTFATLYVCDTPVGLNQYQLGTSGYTTTTLGPSDGETWKWMKARLMLNGEFVNNPTLSDPVESSTYASAVAEPWWANYDIPNYVDGTLLLAASEPVPVYE